MRQEKLSGVKYETVQRAHAEEIMGEGIYGDEHDPSGGGRHGHHASDISGNEREEESIDSKRKFELSKDEAGVNEGPQSTDSIAGDAMLNQGKVSEERWEGDPEAEVENFVQEELYIHGKVGRVSDLHAAPRSRP